MLKTKFYTFRIKSIKNKEFVIVEEQGYAESLIKGEERLKVCYHKEDNFWAVSEAMTGMRCSANHFNRKAEAHNTIVDIFNRIIEARNEVIRYNSSSEASLKTFLSLMTEEQNKNHLDLLNKLNLEKYIVFLD